MSPSRFLKAQIYKVRCRFQRQRLLRSIDSQQVEAIVSDWSVSLKNPTAYYLACFQYFNTLLDPKLREHRNYFTSELRGFGEDAFHVMWWMIFERLRPSTFLEIGVYRGQTLSLAGFLQKKLGIDGVTAGISPFEPAGDSVSSYLRNVDYFNDTLLNVKHFDLKEPILVKGFSTNAEAVTFIGGQAWDCIYIDGNHDYEIARADWDNCSRSVKIGGVIVLDDSSLDTEFRPPLFATAGHPGPSKIAQEIDRSTFTEVLRVGHNRVFQRSR